MRVKYNYIEKGIWINYLLLCVCVRRIYFKVNIYDLIKSFFVKCSKGLRCKVSNIYKFFWFIIFGLLFLVIFIVIGGFGFEVWDEV